MRSLRGFALTLALLLLGLAPAAHAGAARADLSRLVVIGDSLSAGFQNGSLLAEQQAHGYASLVAGQAGVDLPLPEIAYPGIPNVLTLVDPGPPPLIVEAAGVSTGRIDPQIEPFDLAVPAARVADALAARPDFPLGDLTDLILGLPGLLGGVSRSQVEWAEALQPTTIDGIHPTNTGYAILANEFIETLNSRFDARIPEVDEREVLQTDPLVFGEDADQHGRATSTRTRPASFSGCSVADAARPFRSPPGARVPGGAAWVTLELSEVEHAVLPDRRLECRDGAPGTAVLGERERTDCPLPCSGSRARASSDRSRPVGATRPCADCRSARAAEGRSGSHRDRSIQGGR